MWRKTVTPFCWIVQTFVLIVLFNLQLARGRVVEVAQVVWEESQGSNAILPSWIGYDTWTDRDTIWQYGNDGSCTGFLVNEPGAVIDTVSFSFKNPSFRFPWYLDHIEIHRTKWCEDPNPLKIPLESEASFLDLNPGFASEISLPEHESSVVTQSQTEISTSKQNSPGEDLVENMSGIFSTFNGNGAHSALDNEAALSRAQIKEVQDGSESDLASRTSLSDYYSAPGRLETPTSDLEDDILTWKLWPTLNIPAPVSVRFVTNYHKKRVLPIEI
ncbi:hypothetical protein AOL_s00097g345 [Orbilia oligospora ATCC 24927]|uniref:Uncharacterized protein n=1 Tax=Arthrobotrys oligospora (strain ATCC 24927 / CBS 115.81 / DSM 1491) TaxID=756982 RepID=G1XJ18_ARTOA|nr:hypothetical protein AOL_s00097g345 [Orbilia oligospora ATCC 24927]EGX46919.1 hypothetical protein AOL_s00097g345 [Orbilia oligospora ATCC 24927]